MGSCFWINDYILVAARGDFCEVIILLLILQIGWLLEMSKLVRVSLRDYTACVYLNILTEWLTNTSLGVWLQVGALESRCHH